MESHVAPPADRVPALDRPLRRVVVVGAGLAGLRACEGLRRGGFDGDLVLVGAEEHAPYDRPPLSKQYLAGSWERDRLALRTPEQLTDLRLELRLGEAARSLDLDERVVHVNGGVIPFDGLVLATGAEPRHLPHTPPADGLHYLRTLDDCRVLRRVLDEPGARLVVIGAGFIGSEVASTAAARGASVTVVEAAPVPLVGAIGEQMGRVCADLHADAGVTLRCGVGVEEVVTDGTGLDGGRRVTGVRLADDTLLPADVVVVGVGVRPGTDWLEGSGLHLSDGVQCDETLHAAPGVVAAGDVARWHDRRSGDVRLEHWENAAEQGSHAAASLLAGAGATPYDEVGYFWSDQYGVKIQLVGRARPGDEVEVVEGSVDERRFVACYGRAGKLVAVLAFARPRLLVRYRQLLVDGATFDEARAYEPG